MHLYKLLFLGHRNLIKKITQTAGEEGRVREGKELHAVSTYSFGGQWVKCLFKTGFLQQPVAGFLNSAFRYLDTKKDSVKLSEVAI